MSDSPAVTDVERTQKLLTRIERILNGQDINAFHAPETVPPTHIRLARFFIDEYQRATMEGDVGIAAWLRTTLPYDPVAEKLAQQIEAREHWKWIQTTAADEWVTRDGAAAARAASAERRADRLVHGVALSQPGRCPRPCGECSDGSHHFVDVVRTDDGDFACLHCDATTVQCDQCAEAVPFDDPSREEETPLCPDCQRDCANTETHG